MIKIRDLTFEYFDRDDDGYLTEMINAIRGIHFDAQKGDFIAIAGKNGSGKSTFAKILNRLVVPIEGTVLISGLDAMDEDNVIEIRKHVGMVFQNPDDQLIGSIVAEDVAFGAENIGVPQIKLWERVISAIEMAGLVVYGNTNKKNSKKAASDRKKMLYKRINDLSGGEKQKVALAGVLAMEPECIVLDEATSMLDPQSRKEILDAIKQLNEKLGITVIMITHLMEELSYADMVYIMHNGTIAMKGRPKDIFAREKELLTFGLDIPACAGLGKKLFEAGITAAPDLYGINDMANSIKSRFPHRFFLHTKMPNERKSHKEINPMQAVLADDISFSYGNKKIFEHVSFSVSKGEYVAIIGRTGAGKTTLLQHIPGLLKPQNGHIYVDGVDLWDKYTDIRKIRCKVGYVFQYPEQQLFAKNVYEDVVFGPRNIGISEVEAEKRAYESIKLVGLPEDVYDLPLDKLSGGQRRRVALAGILAMQPDYLILDEPVAGLDPEGKRQMLEIINALNKEAGITIIAVSHDMESIAKYADRVLVFEDKGAEEFSDVREAFYHMYMKYGALEYLPVGMQLLVVLRSMGLEVDCFETDVDGAVNAIKATLK
ncbi:MAG: energy-coupling factor transporter ATPase [Clostridium sp.]|nr:energy-coupling factor transporter ATPase [Clostridium sp.]